MSAASVLIASIRDQLHDTIATYRWSDAELLRYLSLGQNQIVSYIPEANAVEVVHAISDTNPRRTISATGVQFVKVICNAATTVGNLPTGSVTYVEEDQLNQWEPDWRTTAPTSPDADNYYQHYLFDRREPTRFSLYPRPTSGTKVRVLEAQECAELATAADNLTLSATYNPALVDYGLYRALAKEGRHQDPAKAIKHLDNFLAALGIKRQNFRDLKDMRPPSAD